MSPGASLRLSARSICTSAAVVVLLCVLSADAAYAKRRAARARVPVYTGPALAEIVSELQKPLPPLEQTDAPYLRELAQPPELGVADDNQWPSRLVGLLIYASLFIFGWCIATGRVGLRRALSLPRMAGGPPVAPMRRKPMTTAQVASTFRRVLEAPRSLTAVVTPVVEKPVAAKRPAPPQVERGMPGRRSRLGISAFASAFARSLKARTAAAAPRIDSPAAAKLSSAPLPQPGPAAAPLQLAAPEPLTKSQIIHFKALGSFASWRELLTAARAGNRIAREVLDGSPAHPAVTFALSAAEFTRHFAWVRNVVLSREWVDAIVDLLRAAERFDRQLTIVTPFGSERTLGLEAPIEVVNTVLGYEELPREIRRQLELRRWILWHTRTDGQQHPEVLADFAAEAAPLVARASAGD